MQNTLNTGENCEISVSENYEISVSATLFFWLYSILGFVPELVSTFCLICLVSLPEHSTEGQILLCQLPPSYWFGFALEAVKGNPILNAPFSWQRGGVGKSVTLLWQQGYEQP